MLELAIAAAAAAVASLLVRLFVAAHRWHLAQLRFHRGRFFELAHALLRDRGIDDARLLRIRAMAVDMGDPRMVILLMSAVLDFNRQLRSGEYRPLENATLPEQWGVLIYDYFMAISYSRMTLGWLIRLALARVLDPKTSAWNTDFIDRRVHSMRLQPT